jgi:hypothetical protein
MSHAVRRTAAFAMAVAVLLGAARGGAPKAGVLVLFVGFVVVATVWVRGQYVDWREDVPWLLPWKAAVALMVLGFATIVVFTVSRWDGLGLLGAILMYFGAGFLVMRWREHGTNRFWWGAGLLAGSFVLSVLGFALLGRVHGAVQVLPLASLVIALVVLLPLAVSQLSEWLLRLLAQESHAHLRLPLGAGGAAVFGAMAVGAALWTGSAFVVFVFIALAFVVIALASTTQADIVAVLALLALMGITPQQATVPGALRNPNEGKHVLVALGDSYMSGEGASYYYKGTDDGGGDTCRRAPTAWAAMAGQQRPFDKVAFLACSGARTVNVLEKGMTGEPGSQLSQIPSAPADLVVLSIGGNDAGFSTIGLMCVAPGNCDDKQDLWLGGLDEVSRLLDATYTKVGAAFPSSAIIVTAYPNPIDNAPHDCGQAALSTGERAFVVDFVKKLNLRIKAAAEAHGFHYLGEMESSLALAHLQLCDPLNDGRPGLNFIGLRSVSGIAEQRFNPANWSHSSLHPNERGHAAMLRVFETYLADQGPLAVRVGTPSYGAPASLSASPQCDLFDIGEKGCRPQGKAWAEQQLGLLVLTKGWLGLLALTGAWLAAVSLFAWRKPSA